MTNIYVGNLPRSIKEEELSDIFAAYGTVEKVTIIMDKFTGTSRGFGFVEMPDDAQAQAAIEALNETDVQGRTITVNPAKPKTNDRPRSGGFGGPRGGSRGGFGGPRNNGGDRGGFGGGRGGRY